MCSIVQRIVIFSRLFEFWSLIKLLHFKSIHKTISYLICTASLLITVNSNNSSVKQPRVWNNVTLLKHEYNLFKFLLLEKAMLKYLKKNIKKHFKINIKNTMRFCCEGKTRTILSNSILVLVIMQIVLHRQVFGSCVQYTSRW